MKDWAEPPCNCSQAPYCSTWQLLGVLSFFNPLSLAFALGVMIGWRILFADINLLSEVFFD